MIIENLNRGIRKYTKSKTKFMNDNSASKSLYLAIQNIQQVWQNTIPQWGLILNQLKIIFGDRYKI
jgi:putative transposase